MSQIVQHSHIALSESWTKDLTNTYNPFRCGSSPSPSPSTYLKHTYSFSACLDISRENNDPSQASIWDHQSRDLSKITAVFLIGEDEHARAHVFFALCESWNEICAESLHSDDQGGLCLRQNMRCGRK